MARVAVGYKGMKDPDAKTAPVREPVPEGIYIATIMTTVMGNTKGPPVLSKMTVEFQILYAIRENDPHDEAESGRRVYQDYILEPDERYDDLSKIRRHELVTLFDATDVEYDDDGFDNDHLVGKPAKITVRHRKSRDADEDGNYRIFSNVVRVDGAEETEEGDVL